MSGPEILTEIERLRRVMGILSEYGCSPGDLLEISRDIDMLIVMYHKTAR